MTPPLMAGPPTPWDVLHQRLRREVEAVRERGDEPQAAALATILDDWWPEQQAWCERACDVLGVHHEINNALVGIRGNAQLLLRNPAALPAGIRERLEVVLRESGRIQEATSRLRELKTGLGGPASGVRAA